MNVLVVGGSGFIGTALATELHERGHDVTVLSRDPGDDDLPEGVDTAAGDVTAYNSIEGSFAGADAVVNLVALSPLFKTPKGQSHESVHLVGTEHVVEAAEAHDLDRIVQMSALDADPDGPTRYLRAKGNAEAVVRDADVDHVIVRPSVVFGDGAEFVSFTKRAKRMFAPYLPIAPLPGGGKTPFQPIAIDDLAPMLADCVDDESHVDETYELGGPTVYTLATITRMVYEAEGRRVYVVPIPMPLAGVGLTVLGAIPPFPFGREQYRALGVENVVGTNDVTAFGRSEGDLQSFETYLGIEG